MSLIDTSGLLPDAPAPSTACSAANQQRTVGPTPPQRLAPPARQVVQSLAMQMSAERLEKAQQCNQPYFAADSMIAAYIDSRINFCDGSKSSDSNAAGSAPLGPSRISCLPLHALAQFDNPTLCEARAVALNLPLLVDSADGSPWLRLQRGALVGSCVKQHRTPHNVLTHCLHDWFQQAFITDSNVTCDEWVDDDAYIITRHDSMNHWHTLSDMWFAFVSAVVFNVQPHSSRVIFADSQPSGPARWYWSAAFTAAAPLPLQQLAQQAMRRGVRTLCFRRAIFNPPATTSALERGYQHVLGPMACSDNMLLQAFAAHSRALVNSAHAPPLHDSSTLSLFILKDDSLPAGGSRLFALLQRHFASSLSITVANAKRSSFRDIVDSVARTSILISTNDAASAFAVYLRPHSACVSLQFDQAPLLRLRLVTSWARVSHYRFASALPVHRLPTPSLQRFRLLRRPARRACGAAGGGGLEEKLSTLSFMDGVPELPHGSACLCYMFIKLMFTINCFSSHRFAEIPLLLLMWLRWLSEAGGGAQLHSSIAASAHIEN